MEWMTLTEAAAKWGLSGGATIRMALKDGRFPREHAHKSGGTWLVSEDGMRALWGSPKA